MACNELNDNVTLSRSTKAYRGNSLHMELRVGIDQIEQLPLSPHEELRPPRALNSLGSIAVQ